MVIPWSVKLCLILLLQSFLDVLCFLPITSPFLNVVQPLHVCKDCLISLRTSNETQHWPVITKEPPTDLMVIKSAKGLGLSCCFENPLHHWLHSSLTGPNNLGHIFFIQSSLFPGFPLSAVLPGPLDFEVSHVHLWNVGSFLYRLEC